MKALDRPFDKIINGTTQFVIPVFQRDYNWTEAECEQLWKDILDIAVAPGDRGHFLGSVVYIATGDTSAGFTRWLLIDGQQRVATITLLLAALRDHIVATKWTGDENGPTAKRIEAYFLKNLQEEGTRLHKLVLRRRDQDTLQAILDVKALPAFPSERIRDNYEFFRDQLETVDPALAYAGIGRLIVVDVTLIRGQDDPQLIFESLNSTGIDLSQSDLIRNFILMRLPEPEQTRLYEEYWNKIEALFRESESTFDSFIRDFLALKTRASKQEKANSIYIAFRRHFAGLGYEGGTLDTFLAELLRFGKYYAAFSIGSGVTGELKASLARLRRLIDVPATLIMRLFDCHANSKTLPESEFIEGLVAIESYVFRRAICGDQTRNYWQVFANLAYQIDTQQPLDSLKVGLARLHGNYMYPPDTEFRSALEDRDIYGKRVCFDLLDRLENYENREPTDTSRYTIEHVMPQNPRLAPAWKEMLGSEWKDIQRQWLHRLGNLTLTGYNSTYSDRPFGDKKTIAGGLSDSSVRLNRYIRDREAWTEREIEHRGKELAAKALKIWPPLSVDHELVEDAETKEMRARAQRRDVGKVAMSSDARELFDSLRTQILQIDEDIIEIAEAKSISYYVGTSFFLEVLPRKRRITLLLALDFNEIDDPHQVASDATQWKFLFYAQHEGGVLVSIRERELVGEALPLIRQAYSRASN